MSDQSLSSTDSPLPSLAPSASKRSVDLDAATSTDTTASAICLDPLAPAPASNFPADHVVTGGGGARVGAEQLAALLDTLRSVASAAVSIHVSTTAKGRLQFEMRVPYADLATARASSEHDLLDLIGCIRAAAHAAGFILAGDDED